ncbi:hypothetical protein AAZX31_19G109600 [Glycine max]|uniref:DUF3741 domain-containing protein n=1 Tax=Glycine max TaxID=3847 RepID=I1N8I9_SOYBN|nr:uncharacterized protein LOC100803801 [Glycine max]KAG4912817.1 hypothetical protein JHK86_053250 [Glycine max]KAG4927699.1 hypothetical protein JHK85_054185 [Glycine max]KAG5083229.1 hypothetical protein JHK84_053267 [Glycine max]KAH1077477.1 hypothetical protein GYH30_052829 [Glycine max]KAH1194476.1 hypothetical protein GmHk_19G055264 [Glycine max]|eukprot:XP_003553371.1 uncharacterized protein LOC100803801 [Glycine max]
MKRQSSAVSPSSSRRETPPEKIHAKTIGCMSGILHFISSSNSRRSRRFLTFGKRQINKNPASTPADAGNLPPENAAADDWRLSSDVPRSPTLPAEIRRSSAKAPPPERRREAPALVARLMGLEAAPAEPTDTVAEKRQKLLGALQRCDEDLKALKKIIETVRLTDPPPPSTPSPSPALACIGFEDKFRTVPEVKCSVVNGEQQQPSPVSVLDEFTRSPLSPSCHSGRHSFPRIQHQKQQLLKKPGEEDISSTYIYERMAYESVNRKVNDEDHLVMWSSKAMIKSVDEVCRDVAWGEKRELGRIGLALQDYICRDLIEEIVRELGCFYTLPFEACKRRLCF